MISQKQGILEFFSSMSWKSLGIALTRMLKHHRLVIRRVMDVKNHFLGGNPREVTIVKFQLCVLHYSVFILFVKSRVLQSQTERKKLHNKGMIKRKIK